MATSGRFVDKIPPPEKPTSVEVIVMGLSRTGTMSMSHALPKLGYKSYHMSAACMDAGKGSLIMWNEAIKAKYGPSPSTTLSPSTTGLTPYGAPEFAKLLQGYTATSDTPTVLFVPELLAAYPNAKLILTRHPRGVDAWLKSIKNSYYRVTAWWIFDWILIPWDKAFTAPYIPLLRRIMEIWCGNLPYSQAKDFDAMEPRLRKRYLEHNAECLALAKAQGRPVLDFEASMGWEPLCRFLGKEVPEGAYSHVNEGDFVVDLHKGMVWMRLKATFGTSVVVLGLAALGVAVGAWWWVGR